MLKKSRFRGPFHKQHGKRAQILFKSAPHHLYQIHWSHPSQLSWTKSLLLTCKILGLLVNALASDEKHPLRNRDNLTISIQKQLSKTQKTSSQYFAAILKYRWNFDRFGKKKNDLHRFCISEIRDSENVVR